MKILAVLFLFPTLIHGQALFEIAPYQEEAEPHPSILGSVSSSYSASIVEAWAAREPSAARGWLNAIFAQNEINRVPIESTEWEQQIRDRLLDQIQRDPENAARYERILANRFGITSIPEPGTTFILSFAGLQGLLRRRRL
ncbi:PEP-CTERM sorting domain-containing protein [Roseibacillus ishigakijimensis]|uniref:PEP-CTERM sorting domain-containing protein n=1 Tax=Roseibacillus ishigakijimensis TaxID=454146 RepID=A0A934RIU9_9BACT|nr:PEP-CTERM sorting domain-containing protein [Roseibacillus ishigakijimensis]MBK1832432.1 PEP-CTERM sorting domain-containing protein [Roseibacillus ishigakijimensis]